MVSLRSPARGEWARGAFWLTAFGLLGFKLVLSALLPFTGDEAYFYYWGVQPDWGFYDHPPMIGWWLALMQTISHAEWVQRLPITLLPLPLAGVAWWLTRGSGRSREHAWLAALVVLLAPVHVWAVFITTDTPLIFFSFLSVAAYVVAVRQRSLLWHALAGLALGLAFLSKYFSFFLGVAFLAHVFLVRRDATRWRDFAVLVLCALPGPAINIGWNIDHCWANLMFNVYNRHEGAGWSWRTPLLYGASLLYVLSPFALMAALRHGHAARAAMRSADEAGTLFWLALVPFGLFGMLSLVKVIGLHWLLSFVPVFLLGVAFILAEDALRRLVRWLIGFAVLQVVVIAVLLAIPLSAWNKTSAFPGLVLTLRAPDLLAHIKPYENDYVYASDGYSNAVTLGYNAGRYFFVFGPGSSHARHDDLMFDLRPLDGKNILILRKRAPQPGEYAPYFRSVTEETFEVEGARFWMIRGQGFDFAHYRQTVLRDIRDRWYRLPGYLPTRHCYFCERYFPEEPWPTR